MKVIILFGGLLVFVGLIIWIINTNSICTQRFLDIMRSKEENEDED